MQTIQVTYIYYTKRIQHTLSSCNYSYTKSFKKKLKNTMIGNLTQTIQVTYIYYKKFNPHSVADKYSHTRSYEKSEETPQLVS